MKKLLTLIFFSIILFGYAQQKFQLFDSEGTSFVDKQKISAAITEIDLNRDGEYIVTIYVDNLLDIDLNVQTKRTNGDLMEGMTALVCFGNCYEPDIFDIAYEMMGKSSETFQLKLKPDECYCYFGMSQFTLEFWSETDKSDILTLFVEIEMQPLSVKENPKERISLSAYPNPVSENSTLNISYTLPEKSINNYLVIKNIVGVNVMRMPLQPHQNKISIETTNFPSGVYFYAIESNYQVSIAKKLIIK